jgi:hypothetical protein
MRIRERIWAGVIVTYALGGLTACDDDKEQAAKLAEVQRIADEKLKKSEKAATDKIADLEKQVASLKGDLETQAAKLKSEAEQAIGKAQADVEEQTKAAETALKKAREAYKAEGRTELASLNKQLQEVQIKLAKAPAKVKTAAQPSMKKVVEQQQQIAKDLTAFDKAAVEQLATTKGKLVQDLAKLKQTIAGLKAKVG